MGGCIDIMPYKKIKLNTDYNYNNTKTSVAASQAEISGNRTVKNLKLFEVLDQIKGWGVLCQL